MAYTVVGEGEVRPLAKSRLVDGPVTPNRAASPPLPLPGTVSAAAEVGVGTKEPGSLVV